MARNTLKSGAGTLKAGVSLALAATTLLALSACLDPGATAAENAPAPSSSSRQPEAKHLYLNTGYTPQIDLEADPETIGPLAFTKEL